MSEILPSSDIEAIKNYNSEFDRLKGIVSKYPTQINNATIAQKAYNSTLVNASDKVKKLQENANGGKIAIDGLTKSSKAAELGMRALAVAGNMVLIYIVSSLISGIYKLATYQQTLADSASETGSKLKESAENIADYKTKIEELQNTINDSSSSYADVTQARKDLMTIQDEMIDKYGDEKGAIDNITDAIKGQTDELD